MYTNQCFFSKIASIFLIIVVYKYIATKYLVRAMPTVNRGALSNN